MKGIYDMFSMQIFSYTFQPGMLLGILALLILAIFGVYKLISRKLTKRTPIWACGYPYDQLPKRAQYSAFGLIHPLRKIYREIYMEMSVRSNARTEGQTYTFKKSLSELGYSAWNSYFVDNIYEKIVARAQILSTKVKQLQNGVLQYYISYIFVALVGVVIWLYFSI